MSYDYDSVLDAEVRVCLVVLFCKVVIRTHSFKPNMDSTQQLMVNVARLSKLKTKTNVRSNTPSASPLPPPPSARRSPVLRSHSAPFRVTRATKSRRLAEGSEAVGGGGKNAEIVTAVIRLSFVAPPGHAAPDPQTVEYRMDLSLSEGSQEVSVSLGQVDYGAIDSSSSHAALAMNNGDRSGDVGVGGGGGGGDADVCVDGSC